MSAPDPTQGFSRRALLRGGLAGLALVSVSGVGLALQPTKTRALPTEGLRVLSATDYAILSALAARLLPGPAPGVPGAAALDVGLLADRLLEFKDDDVKAGIKTALAVFESGLGGALFFERARPFTQLSTGDQDAVIVAWRDSSVVFRRTVLRALNSLCGSLYYGDERVFRSVGYPGPPDPAALRVSYADNLVDWSALRAPGERA